MANSLMLLSRVGAAANRAFTCKMCNRKFPSFQALDNGRRLPPCSGAGKAKDARVLYLRAGVCDRAGAWTPSHHRRKGRAAEDRPSLDHSVGSKKRERLLDLSLTLAPMLSVLNLGIKKMPGSTGTGEGLDNKETKRMKYSDAQPQEVEEEKTEAKAKEVTNQGSESFSTAKPSCEQNSEIQQQEVEEGETEVASDTKRSGFDPTIAKASGGKNIALLLQLKNQEEDSVIQQQEREPEESKVATNSTGSDSGDSSENDINESELPDIFLFKLPLARSNRLVVPVELAADFFPSLSVGADAAEVLRITDYQDDEWNMSFTYYSEESVFMFTKGWTEFAARHNLEAMDVIRFYLPVPRLGPHHYLILHERRQENLATTPEFRRENFLFRIELNTGDIRYCRLFIPGKEVEIHFPAIKQIHGTKRKKEIVKFTDAGNKNWYMDIIRYDDGSYMIMDGWDEFEKEHSLEAMDSIGFYKPVHPSHEKHFLIEIARKVKAETNRTQSAAASFVDSGSSCDLSRRRGRPI